MQIIFSFLQEDEPNPLHIIANFLLADGRSDDTVFGRMISEGCFPRLLDFLNSNLLMDPPLYHTLLELMYEMCRMERLRTTDLLQIDDSFIARLLQLVKEGSGDSDDPYQYSVIRVLVSDGPPTQDFVSGSPFRTDMLFLCSGIVFLTPRAACPQRTIYAGCHRG